MALTIKVNGVDRTVDVESDTPLLWVLRDVLGMTGTKFGCGIAQCGACTVQIDGEPVRSCLLSVGSIGGRKITTIEEIGATEAGRKIQKAWLDLEVVQCGYCQSGQIMSASALLARTSDPKDSDIDAAMAGNICRCGTYVRIRAAISEPPVGMKETTMASISSAPKLTRRRLVKATAAAGGGLILSLSFPGSTPGVVKVTGFTDALDDTPARKRRPTRQVRATPPMQSSVSACKPAG